MGQQHGICVPLSSLHTRHSCGIGELLDLIPLLHWMHALGLNVLQLLPLNDTGHDSSPYMALSTCALNPVYLSLHALPNADPSSLAPLQQLTRAPYVDYLSVRRHKETWLENYLQHGAQHLKHDPEYCKFVENESWLGEYAEFTTRLRQNRYCHWSLWQQAEPPPVQIEREKMGQFLLYRQLREVKLLAQKLGIALLGDLPLLLSSQSVEAWKYPHLFDLEATVGAPPDQFSDVGQSWGFPFIRWIENSEELLSLWNRRLRYSEHFYDIYRLDHVIGFFRLWKIPPGTLAKEGSYVPPSVDDALLLGKSNLEALCSMTAMRPLGEDLGVVLPEFRHVLSALKIPGIKVMRWERRWDGDLGYIPVELYEPLNLTTVSTHDTETLEQWWNTWPQEASRYCQLKKFAYRPFDKEIRLLYLFDSHHSGTLFHVNLLNEYLALYPELVHDSTYEERINIPGTLPDQNWRYRLRLPLEETLAHQPLKDSIASLLA